MNPKAEPNGKTKAIIALTTLLQAMLLFGISVLWTELTDARAKDIKQTAQIAVLEAKLDGIEDTLAEIKLSIHDLAKDLHTKK